MQGKRYFSFVGIPYAQPPVKELRFRNPKQVDQWPYVLDATIDGSCCTGLDILNLARLKLKWVGEEDCLYLKVFSPKFPKSSQGMLPVIVYLYGGGFITGCADEYGPDIFMDQKVILVVPNTRLSVLGYLSTEDANCPGNWAAKDQILALKWVQSNIEKFGGDPNRVTIFGQSAGGVGVNTLLLSKRAKGLFHRAIMASGTNLCFWAYQTQQRQVAFDVGLALGIETNSSKVLVEKLRQVDEKTLMNQIANVLIIHSVNLLTNGIPFTPSVEPPDDEAVLTDYPYNLMKRGDFNRVPVMIGVVSLEAGLFQEVVRPIRDILNLFFTLSPGSYARMTHNMHNRSMMTRKIFRRFLKTLDLRKVSEENLIKFLSEDSFLRPVRKTAQLLARYTDVYFYHFTYQGGKGLNIIKLTKMRDDIFKRDIEGAVHVEDISYLFKIKTLGLKAYQDPKPKDIMMTARFMKLLMNFINTGNPTPVSDPFLYNVTWPKVTADTCPYLNIDDHLKTYRNDFDAQYFEFWEELYQEYADKPLKVY